MKIGIIGTGAYAIALTSVLENKNLNITMWTKLEDEFKELNTNHTNLKVIDYKLNDKIKFTKDMKTLVLESDLLIIAIPAKFLESVVLELKKYYQGQDILIATKGVLNNHNLLIHEYLYNELNTLKVACISGPSFAKDIIKHKPFGLTIASTNPNTLYLFKNLFSNIDYLIIESISDITGCELCGVLKNIMAIVSGILAGMKSTNSTNCKFLVDASHEIQKIIEKFNGNNLTFYTYAGLGDLILTCSSTDSRNYTFGYLIGSNQDFISYKNNTTVEGVENLKTVYEMLKDRKINSKIINILYDIIYHNKSIKLIEEYLKEQN